MLSLDSPIWSRLQHAYGAAADIPVRLSQLALTPQPMKTYNDEPWYSLWSALCHQGDVFSASYAAVPHIIEIGLGAAGALDSGFFLMPVCVEVGRARGRRPEMPADLRAAYFDSLRQLNELVHRHAADEWDVGMTQSVSAALAVTKGHIDLAAALINLDSDSIAELAALGP